MCVNCLSQAEAVAANVALAVAVAREPVHRLLAEAGLVDPPLPVARDARTVAFLRALDLDPVDALGEEAVTAADAWVRAGQPRPVRVRSRALAFASAAPMRSHSQIALP